MSQTELEREVNRLRMDVIKLEIDLGRCREHSRERHIAYRKLEKEWADLYSKLQWVIGDAKYCITGCPTNGGYHAKFIMNCSKLKL